ncbi:hypothetical protein [Lysobacter antibioticus]|uniref:hypothetical protein n=1 Tax=Lysobacter antibioticus TaxID=84531 RepID=UPI0011DFF4F5|nr:hypothetical protein [Lysobacter antibioticus]
MNIVHYCVLHIFFADLLRWKVGSVPTSTDELAESRPRAVASGGAAAIEKRTNAMRRPVSIGRQRALLQHHGCRQRSGRSLVVVVVVVVVTLGVASGPTGIDTIGRAQVSQKRDAMLIFAL